MRPLSIPRTPYFVTSEGLPRVRRPRDVTTAALGLVLIGWALLAGDGAPQWEAALGELILASPPLVKSLFQIGYALSLVYALVVVAMLIGTPGRRHALRDVAIAAGAAIVVVVVLSYLVNDAWPYVLPEIDLENPVPRFPVMRVAMVTAILVVVAPYSVRPLRRFGWLAMLTTTIASVGLGYGSPAHIAGSFGVGLLCAGGLLVVAGSPRGYPEPAAVAAALSALGAAGFALELAPLQTWGVIRYVGERSNGDRIDVKVRGRDAYDSQLAANLWRSLLYRETSVSLGHSPRQAVEHEALATLMAGRAGIAVSDVVAVGGVSPDISLVAVDGAGPLLSDVDAGLVEPSLLVSVWSSVRRLHESGMSHGSLRPTAVRLGSGGPVLTDFGAGALAADEVDQCSDVADLVFSLAVVVGEEAAVNSAREGLGEERLIQALPYLQIAALSPSTRRLAEHPKALMTSIKARVVEMTGATAPEPVPLRRVSRRGLIQGALLLLVLAAVVPALTGVDYAAIWAVLQDADWWWITGAVIIGHLQFFPQATSTMFAVPTKLPLVPLLVLQTASQFIGLAVPSAAGRVAMNAAFLHRFGVPVAAAVAQGAIDGFSGFVVQALILVVALLAGDVDLDIDTADIPWLLVLGVLVLVAAGVVAAVFFVRALRERVVPVLRQGWQALLTVLQEPTRAIGLLVSNFVYWNVLGVTLWALLQAVSVDLAYGSALFVAAGTSLLAGFMPVPGGIGVAEATMAGLLTTLGVDQSIAFAVTALYRVITFYLPALEGFFGTRWLERNEYL